MAKLIKNCMFFLSLTLFPLSNSLAMDSEPVKERLIIENGIWGKYLEPNISDASKPPILLLGGSDGGIPVEMALTFRNNGFPVLTLGYFSQDRMKDAVPDFIPSEFDRIPLELIGNGLQWISNKFPKQKISVVAGSKGAEGFLAFASTGDERLLLVHKVLLRSGASYAFEGLYNINTSKSEATSHSAWTYNGNEIPFIKYAGNPKIESYYPFKMNVGCIYEKSLKKAGKKNVLDQARFSLEKLSHAQVLFLSGTKDKIWPSVLMIEELLKYHSMATNIRLYRFEQTGHAIFAAHTDKTEKSVILFGDTTKETSGYALKIALAFLSK